METKMITINKEKVAEVYQNASDETKEALKALFGNEIDFKRKPTLDDYTTILTYEDACEALGEEPLPYEPNPIMTLYGVEYEVPPHIIALMKLEAISRALWGKDWSPKPPHTQEEWYHHPVFSLYTKREIKNMNNEECRNLVSISSNSDTFVGFGCDTTSCFSDGYINIGFRLCQKNPEKAEYFGKQFIELWAEYLKFNFEVRGRLK